MGTQIVVLDGELEMDAVIDGEPSIDMEMDGESGFLTEVLVTYPWCEGVEF